MAGMAKPVIMSERKGGSAGAYSFMKSIIDGVRGEMAALGFGSVDELRKADVSFQEPLASILEQRGMAVR